MIKLVSFDLWNTLIKSNPKFKEERIKIIAEYYNRPEGSNISVESAISNVFEQCKTQFDVLVENWGSSFKSKYLYGLVLDKLNIPAIHHETIIKKCNRAFIKNLPALYSEDTLNYLSQIKNELGCEIVLISNTLFGSSKILKKALAKLGINEFISHSVFSDEIGMSKPHYKIFNAVYKECTRDEILHVGDNVVTDQMGAMKAGVKAMIINGDDHFTIKDVVEKIKDLNSQE